MTEYHGGACHCGREPTGGREVRVAVEVVGRPDPVTEELEILSPAGTYLSSKASRSPWVKANLPSTATGLAKMWPLHRREKE